MADPVVIAATNSTGVLLSHKSLIERSMFARVCSNNGKQMVYTFSNSWFEPQHIAHLMRATSTQHTINGLGCGYRISQGTLILVLALAGGDAPPSPPGYAAVRCVRWERVGGSEGRRRDTMQKECNACGLQHFYHINMLLYSIMCQTADGHC